MTSLNVVSKAAVELETRRFTMVVQKAHRGGWSELVPPPLLNLDQDKHGGNYEVDRSYC